MTWQTDLSGLTRKLDEAGASHDFRVIARLPAIGYTLLVVVPSALIAAFVITSAHSAGAAAASAAAVVGAGCLAAAYARSNVVLAGDEWVATHGLFGWRIVQLARLRKADVYSSKATNYLRLWDTAGGRVVLQGRASYGPIRALLADAVDRAAAGGADVHPRAVALLAG